MSHRNIVVSSLLFISMSVSAADIKWGLVNVDHADWSSWGGSANTVMIAVELGAIVAIANFERFDNGTAAVLSAYLFSDMYLGMNIVESSVGKIIDADSTDGTRPECVHASGADVGGWRDASRDLIVPYGGEVLLGISVDHVAEFGDKIFGWAELVADVDGNLSISRSAFDFTGLPMIAGGGAIPEPTSAAFVALGLCVLALRQRKLSRRLRGHAESRARSGCFSCRHCDTAMSKGYDRII